MKRKPLWKISVVTTPEAEEAAAELLGTIFDCGASSYFNVESGMSVVSVYISKKTLAREVRKEIRAGLEQIKQCGLNIGPGKISISKIRREDWAESWKRHFKPIEIGRALLVKPGWSKKRPRKNQKVVILDPGLSFGTGQHPTTAFCLAELAKKRSAERIQSFLDLGTGSGILAIAAAKLGCHPVRAVDFDPEAVRIARANARRNRVHKKIQIVKGNVSKLPLCGGRQFDLICANLISSLLVAERGRIVKQLRRGGTLVLAGILKSEFSEVRKALEKSGMKLAAAKTEREWRSGSFCFA